MNLSTAAAAILFCVILLAGADDVDSSGLTSRLKPNHAHVRSQRAVGRTCGRSKYPDAGNMDLPRPRIVGGQQAREYEFPWQVSLRFNGLHFCGGSIISSSWIITAAHCIIAVTNYTRSDLFIAYVTVAVGEYRRDDATSTVRQIFHVKNFTMGDYVKDLIHLNDIALVNLNGSITFNENVTTICLPDPADTFFNQKSVVSGWGHTSYEGESSNILLYATLNTTTNALCDAVFMEKDNITVMKNSTMCAQDNAGDVTRDVCQDDSGGPLSVRGDDGAFTLAGLVSWGIYCAAGYPGIYTRVTYYLGYINDITGVVPPTTVAAPPPTTPTNNAVGWTCGKSKYPDAGNMDLARPRIVGGQQARPYEFPWQVSLRFNGLHFCGGSIISSSWIITAAHCIIAVTNYTRSDLFIAYVTVAVGEYRRDDATSTVRQIFQVKNFTMGDYVKELLHLNDIALVNLNGSITFNENVTTICLPEPTDSFMNEKSVVSGWGHTSYGGESSNILLYATLNTTTNALCDAVFMEKDNITVMKNSTMCAQDNAGDVTRDVCQDDSGGPLAVRGDDGAFTLAGLVSWGIYCAAGYPGIYTRVTYYLGYINDITGVVPPTTVAAPPPTTPTNNAGGWTCGKSKYPDAGNMDLPRPRIVGGQQARPYEFPWQVSFRFDGSHFCGGSIITSSWIITAAHCITGITNNSAIFLTNVTVAAGEYILSDTASTVRQVFKIVSFTMGDFHQELLFLNDIALVKLNGSITFNENVVPICLPDKTDTFINQKSVISGWGHTSFKGSLSDTLLYATVNSSSNAQCDAVFMGKAGQMVMNNSTMCAQDNTGDFERDVCQGDSGGPLAVKGADGSFKLAGLVSFGENCSAGFPGIYTRVSYYIDFINNLTAVVPPTTVAATTSTTPKPNVVGRTCGKSKYPDAGSMDLPRPKIVGGQQARPYEFPWQVSLRVDGIHFCGGSIISSSWIITAAHCVTFVTNFTDSRRFMEHVTVAVGDYTQSIESTVRQFFRVLSFSLGDFEAEPLVVNDIALVKLNGSITFNENVTAICLPYPTDTFINRKCVASGWGQTSYMGEYPDTLLYATLNTTSNDLCDAVFIEKLGGTVLTDSTICTQDNTGDRTRDVCQGDSGGPLAVKDDDGSFTLAGLVSWGLNCSDGFPGIYTRVTYYLDYINNVTGVVPPATVPPTTSDSPAAAVVTSFTAIAVLSVSAAVNVFLFQRGATAVVW